MFIKNKCVLYLNLSSCDFQSSNSFKVFRYSVRGEQLCLFHFYCPYQWDQLLKARICSYRSKFFLVRLDSFGLILGSFIGYISKQKVAKIQPFCKNGGKA